MSQRGPAQPDPARRDAKAAARGPALSHAAGNGGRGGGARPARPPAFLLPGALPAPERGGGGGGCPARSWIRPRSRGPGRSGEAANCALGTHRLRRGAGAPRWLPRPRGICPAAGGAARSLPPSLRPSPAFPRDRGPRMAGAPRWLPQPFRPAPVALRPRAVLPQPSLCFSRPRDCPPQPSQARLVPRLCTLFSV